MRKLLNKLIAAVSAAAVAIAGVNFGGIGGLNLTAAAETVGTFTVTGGTLDEDYTYGGNVLKIISDTEITISGTTTTDRIEVASGVSANIIFNELSITSSNNAAFKIADNSKGNVTIDLKGENTLKSGGEESAGLQKNGNGDGIGKLTIKSTSGDGKLTATGSTGMTDGGAGIGGGTDNSSSNITISGGIVTANGGFCAAGIGGGKCGSGSDITIQ